MTFQRLMTMIFGDMDHVVCYLDDILVFSQDKTQHEQDLREVFKRLNENGLRIRIDKSNIRQDRVKFLGFEVSSSGIRPALNATAPVLQLQSPRNTKELRRVLGMLNFYRGHIQDFTHIAQPLHELLSNSQFQWKPTHEQALRKLLKTLTEKTILKFPDLNEPFQIHADASDYGAGGVVSQKSHPVFFFSKKFTGAQKNYTTMEKETLAIIWILKTYETVLRGAKIQILSDHLNLRYLDSAQSQRCQRWRTYLQEFEIELKHIAGKNNVIADTLSRDASLACSAADTSAEFPLDPEKIIKAQEACEDCRKEINLNPGKYEGNPADGIPFRVANNNRPLLVPTSLREDILTWTHKMLGHPGRQKLHLTLKDILYWPHMFADIEALTAKCQLCQQVKDSQHAQGTLNMTNEQAQPWEIVSVDLIGPFRDDSKSQISHCLTILDHATRIVEIIGLKNIKASTVAQKFDKHWLCRYPRPSTLLSDQGTQFLSNEFQELLQSYGIHHTVTSSYHPETNGMIERMHATINTMIRSTIAEGGEWRTKLPAISWALRTTFHRTLGSTPFRAAFGRDGIYPDILFDAQQIQQTAEQKLQQQRETDLTRRNKRRSPHLYKKGNKVWYRNPFRTKLSARFIGPYTVVQAKDNNTVRIRNEKVEFDCNITQLKPLEQGRDVVTETVI